MSIETTDEMKELVKDFYETSLDSEIRIRELAQKHGYEKSISNANTSIESIHEIYASFLEATGENIKMSC